MTSVTVPKSIRRINEEYMGYPIRYVFVVVGLLGISVVLFVIGLASSKFLFLIIVSMWYVFFKRLKTPTMVEKSWLELQYLIRGARGQNIIAKYSIPLPYLQSVVPLLDSDDHGIIKFVGDKYGLIVKVDPNRVSDDDIESHIQKMRQLIDSLHGELLMKVFVCSVSSGSYRPLEKSLISTLKDTTKTEHQKRHLYELYRESTESDKSVIQWNFYVFIGLGSYKSQYDAQIAKQQYYPGFESRLIKAGIRVIPVISRNEISRIYRQCICQGSY